MGADFSETCRRIRVIDLGAFLEPLRSKRRQPKHASNLSIFNPENRKDSVRRTNRYYDPLHARIRNTLGLVS
ncbi:UNVERIFIED_CONTAM: hypothetical protein Sangu_2655700 [Sesamum angustifolium]|uniref:Uncharacterized protein n=1 Tax=Sesamum angustifolium TaxID=2727405 RepID=A0AAW2J2H3_9LAMI